MFEREEIEESTKRVKNRHKQFKLNVKPIDFQSYQNRENNTDYNLTMKSCKQKKKHKRR